MMIASSGYATRWKSNLAQLQLFACAREQEFIPTDNARQLKLPPIPTFDALNVVRMSCKHRRQSQKSYPPAKKKNMKTRMKPMLDMDYANDEMVSPFRVFGSKSVEEEYNEAHATTKVVLQAENGKRNSRFGRTGNSSAVPISSNKFAITISALDLSQRYLNAKSIAQLHGIFHNME